MMPCEAAMLALPSKFSFGDIPRGYIILQSMPIRLCFPVMDDTPLEWAGLSQLPAKAPACYAMDIDEIDAATRLAI